MKRLFVVVAVVMVSMFLSTGAWALIVDDQQSTGTYYAGGTVNPVVSPTPDNDLTPAAGTGFSVTGFTATKITTGGVNLIQVQFTGPYFNSTNANPDITTLNGKIGDLYISSTGWKVDSPADHAAADTFNLDEGWNYVVKFGGGTLLKPSATDWRYSDGDVYALANAFTPTSNNNAGAPVFVDFRTDQAFQGGYGATAVADGTVELIQGAGTGTLTFTFDNSTLNWDPDKLGYHWTESCGNDVLEGGLPVPEPASLLLIGLGLVGMAAYRRKTR